MLLFSAEIQIKQKKSGYKHLLLTSGEPPQRDYFLWAPLNAPVLYDQEARLVETVLLSTHNTHFSKNVFYFL